MTACGIKVGIFSQREIESKNSSIFGLYKLHSRKKQGLGIGALIRIELSLSVLMKTFSLPIELSVLI